MAGVKMTGRFAHQVEHPEAVASFTREWLPYVAPSHVDQAWDDFKEGLLDTGWISVWQSKNWATPKFW